MRLQIKGNVRFNIQNLKKGNEITSTMQSGEFVINGVVTPFVLQRVANGRISEVMNESSTELTIICYKQLRSTLFTKMGYVRIMLGNTHVLMWAYIKKDFLKEFFSAICMASI